MTTHTEQHHYHKHVFVEDTDAYQVVYHANYLKYLDQARTTYFSERGVGLNVLLEEDVCLTVRALDIQYIKPARLNDNLIVTTQIIKQTPLRLYLQQCIYRLGDAEQTSDGPGTLLTTAEVMLACVSSAMRPKKLPPQLLAVL